MSDNFDPLPFGSSVDRAMSNINESFSVQPNSVHWVYSGSCALHIICAYTDLAFRANAHHLLAAATELSAFQVFNRSKRPKAVIDAGFCETMDEVRTCHNRKGLFGILHC